MRPLHKGPLRCVITASTGGGVMSGCLKNPFFKSLIHSVVCDQPCGAFERARAHGVPVELFEASTGEEFCDRLREYLVAEGIDYVFSFYTRFYSESMRLAFPDRIVNLHPSLLPAFKGNDAWEYVSAYGARFAGSTVEFIYERMDEGKIIMQALCPWDANKPTDFTRHRVFVQQCQSLLQVAKWLCDQRITTNGCRVIVRGARFDSSEFSPALDFPDAVNFACPAPSAAERAVA